MRNAIRVATLCVALGVAGGCTVMPDIPIGAASADCSAVSGASVMDALRNASSYGYDAHGRLERLADDGRSTDTVSITATARYQAPDRLEVVYQGHTYQLAVTRVLDGVEWIQPHGSLRWVTVADTVGTIDTGNHGLGEPGLAEPVNGTVGNHEANELLAEVERITDWETVDGATSPGRCILSGSGSLAVTGATVDANVNLTTLVGATFPDSIAIDDRYSPAQPMPGAVTRKVLEYRVSPYGDDYPIVEPATDTSAASIDDLRYALRHLGCDQPPCDVAGLTVDYAVHQPGLDVYGYSAGTDLAGEAWFDDGLPTEVRQQPSSTCAFSWHEHWSPSPDGQPEVWLAGVLTLADSAEMQVTYSDGAQLAHSISSPAYLISGRSRPPDGATISSIRVVGSDGSVLYDWQASAGSAGSACSG